MTLIFGPQDGGATGAAFHAFVIGVGDYPHASQGAGPNPDLRNVRNLASAADSAKVMCDWLIDNKDRMVPPLGSIEVLISDPATTPNDEPRYQPRAAQLLQPIDGADAATIPVAGRAWRDRMTAAPGGKAFFYACGHGANYGTLPVLFHSGLNTQPGANAYAHLNIGTMAQAFRQLTYLEAAFFFVDACGEFVPKFPPGVRDDGFISPDLPQVTDRDKVWLLSAASAALLAYPGVAPPIVADPEFVGDDRDDPSVVDSAPRPKLGRFTQTLLKGLNGASARWSDDGGYWGVDNMGLWSDLKALHRTYFPSWNDKSFEPSQFQTPNNRVPIIRHDRPRFPVLVSMDPPQHTGDFDFGIGLAKDGAQPWVDHRPARSLDPWLGHVYGDQDNPFYALAMNGTDPCRSSFFKADEPQFNQRVRFP